MKMLSARATTIAFFVFLGMTAPMKAGLAPELLKTLDAEAEQVARVLLRDANPGGVDSKVLIELKNAEKNSVPHLTISPDGTMAWEAWVLPASGDSFEGTTYVRQVANSWPESTRGVIAKAERNNLNFRWDSLVNYQNIGREVAAKFVSDHHLDATGAASTGDALAAGYRKQLASLFEETRQTVEVLKQLRAAHRSDLLSTIPNLPDLNSLDQAVRYQFSALERLCREVSETPQSTFSLLTTPEMPPQICIGWDEDAKAGYCLNRLLLLKTVASEEGWNRKIKPLVDEFTRASELWKMQSPRTLEPKKMVELSGILEDGISQTTADYKLRFRLLAPSVEASRKLSGATETMKASLNDVVVLNLLPTDASQVAYWPGYSQNELDGYVEWGKRVQNVLNHRNVAAIQNVSTPEEIRTQIQNAKQSKRILVIIGESQDAKNIRLPSANSLAIRGLVPPDMVAVGLFCGSAESLHQVPGLAVHGELRANEAATILKTLLSGVQGGEPTTVGEFLNDSLIFASHRKRAFLLIGGVSAGLEFVPRETRGESPSTNTNTLEIHK